MTRFSEAAGEIVKRHPAPAVSVGELRDLLTGELPSSGLEFLDDVVIERLASEARALRLMKEPRRRWPRPLGPMGWILAGDRGPEAATHARSLESRMRTSLRCMGRAVDPESALSWARWNRLLEEERQARRYFNRRKRARSTTPLPGPPLRV